MKKTLCVLSLSLVLLLGDRGAIHSHCEIPCGIYGDTTRIDLLYEHIATVEKSMQEIEKLSGSKEALDVNQYVRWVGNKETHANEIQEIVTQYFMTQRVKPAASGASDAREKYVAQLTTLHAMLIAAMKCKQTVDTVHTKELRELVGRFAKLYLSPEDLKHVQEHHGASN